MQFYVKRVEGMKSIIRHKGTSKEDKKFLE